MPGRATIQGHTPETAERIIERLVDEVLAQTQDPARHQLMSVSNGDPRLLRALVLTGLGLGELARLGGRWCWRTTEAYDRLVGTVSESSGVRAQPGRAVQLTRREQQILALLSLGLTAQKIGRQLFLSPRTVAKHLERMYRKFGTSDRLSTVLRAQNLGLLHSTPAGPEAASGGNG